MAALSLGAGTEGVFFMSAILDYTAHRDGDGGVASTPIVPVSLACGLSWLLPLMYINNNTMYIMIYCNS